MSGQGVLELSNVDRLGPVHGIDGDALAREITDSLVDRATAARQGLRRGRHCSVIRSPAAAVFVRAPGHEKKPSQGT